MAHKYNKLAGYRILIIGGSSGIGYAVAEGSLASQASVIITSSSASNLSNKMTQLRSDFPSGDVSGYNCDLSSFDSLEDNLKQLLHQAGPIDHVVFTAGDAHKRTPISDMTIERALDAGKIRFFAPLMLAKHLPRHLTSNTCACSLILTNSFAAARATGTWPAEQSFTMAIQGLAETLAIDLKPIRVNVVGPGVVKTKTFDGYLNDNEKSSLFEHQKNGGTLTGEMAEPEGIAEAYLWLMRDRGATGSQVYSDSGAKFVTPGV